MRYLRWQQVQALANIATPGEKLPDFATATAWDTWIRQRDWEVRSHADQMVEDLISSWIVSGTSFTTQPVLASTSDAINAAGILTPVARARIEDFVKGLDTRDEERWNSVLEFLRRRRVTEEELRAYLGGILRRCAIDRANEGAGLEAAPLLQDFAMSETLRILKSGGIAPARVRRVAVIDPGINFSGAPDGYDFIPLQSIQPFALLETIQRLELGNANEVQLSAIAMNPFALAHLRGVSMKVRSAARYIIELPLNTAAGWNAAAMSYWNRFGELIGGPAEPLPVPASLHHVNLRAIAVKPAVGHISVNDLDLVAQTMDTFPGQGFDIVVAMNGFGAYDRVEQSLALINIAAMMNPGGVLLVGGAPSAVVPSEASKDWARIALFIANAGWGSIPPSTAVTNTAACLTFHPDESKGWRCSRASNGKKNVVVDSRGKSKVHNVMKEQKQGKLKSGSGKKVKSRKQAVAIALNEARKSGAKIPKKKKKS